MRIEVLKSFIALAEEGSVTKAAKSLRIQQPTLSRQMAALEKEVEKPLYRHSGGTITLTRDGRILYEYAKTIVEQADRALSDIQNSEKSVSGTVYIGTGGSLNFGLVAEAAVNVRRRHPDIVFEVYSGDSEQLIEKLNAGSLDFMLECGVRPRGRYNSLDLPIHERWGLLVSKHSKLFGLEVATVEDLAGEDILISRQAHRSKVIKDWMGPNYDKVRPTVRFDLGSSIEYMVRMGMGSAVGYVGLIEPLCDGVELRCVPFEPTIFDYEGLVWSKTRLLSHAAQAFLDEILSLVASLPEE